MNFWPEHHLERRNVIAAKVNTDTGAQSNSIKVTLSCTHTFIFAIIPDRRISIICPKCASNYKKEFQDAYMFGSDADGSDLPPIADPFDSDIISPDRVEGFPQVG